MKRLRSFDRQRKGIYNPSMRKAKQFSAVVIFPLLLVSWLLCPAAGSSPDRMVIVYFEDYAPFSWKDKNGVMQGLLVDILTETLQKRMGTPVEHRGYPWARAQKMVEQGEADAFCTVPTDERRQYTEISIQPVIRNSVTLFTWKGNPRTGALRSVKGIKDLSPFSHAQYSGSGWARQNLTYMDVEWVASLSQAIQMLAAGRVDVIAESSFVMVHQIKAMGLAHKIEHIPATIDSNAFHLCVGKKSRFRSLLPRFDRALAQIQRDGTHREIVRRYQ